MRSFISVAWKLARTELSKQSPAAHRDLDPDRAAAAREHQRRVLCYPLKDRMLDLDDFLDARSRVVAGASALDPEVVRRMIRPENERLARLTPRARADGRRTKPTSASPSVWT